MEIQEAIDIVVSRTGHERYRELCDPSNPAYDPGYIPLVVAMACGESPLAPQRTPNPSVALQLANIARMKACPHWSKSSDCGCGNNRCLAGKGKDGIVSHQDCFACLKETFGPA